MSLIRGMLTRLFVGARGREIMADLDSEYSMVSERYPSVVARVWYLLQLLRPGTWRLAWALRRIATLEAATVAPPARGRAWLSGLSGDFRLAWRMLLKSPGLTIVGVLGIAVGTAIGVGAFIVMTGIFYPTLPLDEGERIVALTLDESGRAHRRLLHDFVTWRDELRSVEHVAAATIDTRSLVTDNAPAGSVRAAEMTAAAFHVARVSPLLGRYLVSDDERPTAARVAVLGYDLWQSRFDGDTAVIGRTVLVGGVAHEVVGVMPPGFAMPKQQELWTALHVDPARHARGEGPVLYVFGRLAAGVTGEQAQAELSVLSERAAAAFPETYASLRAQVLPYSYPLNGVDRDNLWDAAQTQLMLTLLLIAIAVNMAVLMYARTAMRQGEIAVRTALGASRRRIIAQLFIEALVLSSLGTALGLAIAHFALGQFRLVTEVFGEFGFWVDYSLQPRSVLFAATLAIVSASIVGILPALKVTGRRVSADLRGLGGTSARLGRGWTALIVAQVGIVVAVLPLAMSIGYEEIRMADVRPTFAAHEFITANLAIAVPLSPGMDGAAHRRATAARLAVRLSELERRLEAEPAIAGMSFEGNSGRSGSQIEVDGVTGSNGSATLDAQVAGVAPDYFELLDARFLAGRNLTTADAGSAVAGDTAARGPGGGVVVNEAFARGLFDEGPALGRLIRFVPRAASGAQAAQTAAADAGPWHEIVGIVQDLHASAADRTYAPPVVYHAVTPPQLQAATLVVRVRGDDVDGFAPRLREITTALDPDLRLGEVANVARQRSARYLAMTVALLQSILGTVVLLSAAGVHALMSVTVTRRRREIGVRAALGAQPARLLVSVFSRAGAQLAFGGLAGSVIAAALLQGSGVSAAGAATFIGLVVALMITAGLIAAVGPALRGLRIQPVEALKEE